MEDSTVGEMAEYKGERIKIGTCEQMYYLRADQVHLVNPLPGSVNPRLRKQAEHLRFRFPFPQEDTREPGTFEDYDYGLGVSGLEPPEDDEIHTFLQLSRNYPISGGILLSIPCPESAKGKANPLGVHYNGYSGKVQIHSQRLVEGRLCLVAACGSCGGLYRYSTLEEVATVLACCAQQVEAAENQYPQKDQHRARFWGEVSDRIVAGYTAPNYWTPQYQEQAVALELVEA